MPDRWHLLDFKEWACREAYHHVNLTNAPCHLWLRWTNRSPWKHPRYRAVRGLNKVGDVYFCFTDYHDVEQDEAGDTLTHTFRVSPWQRFELRWFFFWGEVSAVQSPSMSPIFARYLDMNPEYSLTTVTHENDVVISWMGSIWSCPTFCPGVIYTGNSQGVGNPMGGALRFRSVQLPRCAEILTTHLILQAAGNQSAIPVHSRLSAEAVDNAPDFFAITAPVFWARWAARTGIVDWNNLPPFVNGVLYQTPSLISPVQLVVSRPGWAAGNSLVLFWEDFDQRTPFGAVQFRSCVAYSAGIVIDPVLHVWYNHWQVIEVSAF